MATKLENLQGNDYLSMLKNDLDLKNQKEKMENKVFIKELKEGKR